MAGKKDNTPGFGLKKGFDTPLLTDEQRQFKVNPASLSSKDEGAGVDNYGDIINRAMEQRDEVKRDLDRRHRSEAALAGLVDAGTALGNIYFASKGSPNMLDGKTTLTAKAQERYTKAKDAADKAYADNLEYIEKLRSNELEGRKQIAAEHKLAQEDERLRLSKARDDINEQYKLWQMDMGDSKLDFRKQKFDMEMQFKRWVQEGKMSQQEANRELKRWMATLHKNVTVTYEADPAKSYSRSTTANPPEEEESKPTPKPTPKKPTKTGNTYSF